MCKKYLYILLFLFLPIIGMAQVLPKSTMDELNQTKQLVASREYNTYSKGIKWINSLEKQILLTKNINQILSFYREVYDIYLENSEYDRCNVYINKGFNLLKKQPNPREFGLFCEMKSVLYSYQAESELKEKWNILALYYLNKYGKPEEKIDVNYNSSLYAYKSKKWKKSIYFANECIKNIDISNEKVKRKTFLYVFLCSSHLNLNHLSEAERYFKLYVQNLKERKLVSDVTDTRFHKLKGDISLKKGLYQEAAYHFQQSIEIQNKIELQKNNDSGGLLYLKLKLFKNYYENKKLEEENKANKIKSKYQYYILILSFLIILILIIFSIFQYKNAIYKTKINKILKERNLELRKTNTVLKQAIKTKRRFLDTISHELRTPLNTIKSIAYLIMNKQAEDQKRELSNTLKFSSDYLLNLVNNIIAFNTLNKSKTQEFHYEETNLNQLIINISNSLKFIHSNDNTVHLNLDDATPDLLLIDKMKITQIILNLIDNALKFTKKGDIIIHTKLIDKNNEKARINFHISDTGIGIPNAMLSKIFEPFFQGKDNIKKDYGGNGIGLSVVQKTLNLFHSDIHVISNENKGTTFYFELIFEIVKPKKIVVDNQIDKKKNLHILLVEDNKINQLMTKKILENDGFNCDVANDGAEAVKMARSKKYNLILMDIMMPILNGFEASVQIKTFQPDVPIIALSAVAENINKNNIIKAKMSYFLTKPVDSEVLFETILKYAID
ncbi:hypothetical protein B0A77_13220 [Flavobacterium branchiophilum]|uniref:histidine kinase n=2 Tax=Flavobacterium branchiophilum TaxID=55197 RepID=A0A2H3K960_9FLAO|nr:hypothetical protein B0A77_13220 [Flavobacterium branchiophilum]